MANKSYRIRTNVGEDTVIKATLNQDIDFLEVLSLKINQEDTYKLHVSNYGIIVGRVLANEAFGIPNAKVSIFIELSEEDSKNSEIINFYPYKTITTTDKENRRYNLLQNSSNDECYRVIGTFPNKRMVLDNDTQVEIYEKYWKYTTVTNQSGDFMIFGVPTGNHLIHTDIDLSDIGVLSQKPRDFYYKGYNENLFENAEQFKKSTNLDNLSQILSQTTSVQVYPFFGDKNIEEIAISRCDIKVPYKFEPTCVFIGSVVTDKKGQHIGHSCRPSRWMGYGNNMTTKEGIIEMIRKTQDGLVEEFPIQGNRLIDSDGVWCYQIPMNLDFVGTDEFGNIIPVQNSKKGIPTRTSVRFRVSLQDTIGEASSEHHAKYLIPNIHELEPREFKPTLSKGSEYNKCYEFGSATPSEYFRDLLWNKVYTVKNYIPRLQKTSNTTATYYSGIRSVNVNNTNNIFPYNSARFHLNFTYRVLCTLLEIVVLIISLFNKFLVKVLCLYIGFKFKISKWSVKIGYYPFKFLTEWIHCVSISGRDLIDENSNVEYFPGCDDGCGNIKKCKHNGCDAVTSNDKLMDKIEQTLAHEYDIAHLDFNNDWVNGVLYMPLWYWKKRKKSRYFFGLFKKKAVDTFCNCDKIYDDLRISQGNNVVYNNVYNTLTSENTNVRKEMGNFYIKHGVIKEFINDDDLRIYYYAPGVPTDMDYATKNGKVPYAQLYATDIVLLGSLNSCDLDNLPRPYLNLPSTTNNDLFIATLSEEEEGEGSVTGMDWEKSDNYTQGLLLDLSCWSVKTKLKTAINLHRLSELDVTLDMTSSNEDVNEGIIYADGLITKEEIVSNETRAMFASLNHNGLKTMYTNPTTNYDTYKLSYIYPIDFDGHMSSFITTYTKGKNKDVQDRDYVKYRLGEERDSKKNLPHLRHFYQGDENRFSMPLYNNSFYFYFGLNEGKTAIDKFHTLYNASCLKEEKYPFTIEYSSKPGKWCYNADNVGTDFGTIDVELNGLKPPFSYTLYNEFNEIIISESNVNSEELRFGYDITEGGGSYVYTNDTFKREGRLKYFNTGQFVKDSLDTFVYLENGTYLLEITNSLGHKVAQKIKMVQTPLSPVIKSVNLGTKFYSNYNASDICNNNDYFGEIRIESFIIDGVEVYINDFNLFFDNVNGTNGDDYELSLQVTCTDGSNLLIVLEQNESELTPISSFTCNCVNSVPVLYALDASNNNYILSFNIWKPGEYKITTTQICDNVLNDNTSINVISIENGEKFQAFLNDVPLDMLKIDELNKNENWLSIGRHDIFNMRDTNFKDIEYWNDYLPISTSTNDESISYISPLSKIDIINYQLQMYRNMMEGAYITNTQGSNMFTLTTIGGKEPILVRNIHPNYTLFDNDIDDTFINNSVLLEDSDSVICNNLYPNIVNQAYTFNKSKNTSYNKGSVNSLFDNKEFIGNYFAAFTNNGGFVSLNYNCQRDEKIFYESYPSNSDVLQDLCPNMNLLLTSYPTNINTYVKTLFVDMRLGVVCTIHFPITTNLHLSYENNEWKVGKMHGYIYNGLPMKYDDDYNLIGSGLEYNIYEDNVINDKLTLESDKNVQLYNWLDKIREGEKNKLKNSKFYQALIRIDGREINLNDTIYVNFNNENFNCLSSFPDVDLPSGNQLEIQISNCKLPNEIVYNTNIDEYGVISYDIKAYVEEGDNFTNKFDSSNRFKVDEGEVEYEKNEPFCGITVYDYTTTSFGGEMKEKDKQFLEMKSYNEAIIKHDNSDISIVYFDFGYDENEGITCKYTYSGKTTMTSENDYSFHYKMTDANNKDIFNYYINVYDHKTGETASYLLNQKNGIGFESIKDGDNWTSYKVIQYAYINTINIYKIYKHNGEWETLDETLIKFSDKTYNNITAKVCDVYNNKNKEEVIKRYIFFKNKHLADKYGDKCYFDIINIKKESPLRLIEEKKYYYYSYADKKFINYTNEDGTNKKNSSGFSNVSAFTKVNITNDEFLKYDLRLSGTSIINENNEVILDSISENNILIKKKDGYYLIDENGSETKIVDKMTNENGNCYFVKSQLHVSQESSGFTFNKKNYTFPYGKTVVLFKPTQLKRLNCYLRKDMYNTIFDQVTVTSPILYNANYRIFGNTSINIECNIKKDNEIIIPGFIDSGNTRQNTTTKNVVGYLNEKDDNKVVYNPYDNLLYNVKDNKVTIDCEKQIYKQNGNYHEGQLNEKNMISLCHQDGQKEVSILSCSDYGLKCLKDEVNRESYALNWLMPYTENEDILEKMENHLSLPMEIPVIRPQFINNEDKLLDVCESDDIFDDMIYCLDKPQDIKDGVNALCLAYLSVYYYSGEDHVYKLGQTLNHNMIIDLDEILLSSLNINIQTKECYFKWFKTYRPINSYFSQINDVKIKIIYKNENEYKELEIKNASNSNIIHNEDDKIVICNDKYYTYGHVDDKIVIYDDKKTNKRNTKTYGEIKIGDIIIHEVSNKWGWGGEQAPKTIDYGSVVSDIENLQYKKFSFTCNIDIFSIEKCEIIFTYDGIKRTLNLNNINYENIT